MRYLAGLLSVLLLLTQAAPPALADNEIVLDDDAPGVQTHGTWATSTVTTGFIGSSYHYRVAGDGSSTFAWPFGGPAGRYDVQVRWTSGTNRASNATYTVTSSAGARAIAVDQRSAGGNWHSIGTFDFAAGSPDQGVRLTDKADGIVVADAVRWVPTQNAPAETATTNDPRYFAETRFRIDK